MVCVSIVRAVLRANALLGWNKPLHLSWGSYAATHFLNEILVVHRKGWCPRLYVASLCPETKLHSCQVGATWVLKLNGITCGNTHNKCIWMGTTRNKSIMGWWDCTCTGGEASALDTAGEWQKHIHTLSFRIAALPRKGVGTVNGGGLALIAVIPPQKEELSLPVYPELVLTKDVGGKKKKKKRQCAEL